MTSKKTQRKKFAMFLDWKPRWQDLSAENLVDALHMMGVYIPKEVVEIDKGPHAFPSSLRRHLTFREDDYDYKFEPVRQYFDLSHLTHVALYLPPPMLHVPEADYNLSSFPSRVKAHLSKYEICSGYKWTPDERLLDVEDVAFISQYFVFGVDEEEWRKVKPLPSLRFHFEEVRYELRQAA